MLTQLSLALAELAITPDAPRAFDKQAAVLVALTDTDRPEVVLTLRSRHMTSHSGEVSFPGGWWEPGDASLTVTALREAEEEIGLKADQVELLGAFKSRYARGGVRVQPVVGRIAPGLDFSPNPDELDAVFSVPLDFFLEDRRVRTDVFTSQGREYWTPAYEYDGFEIWGFTAGVLINLLNETLAADIGRDNPAPVRFYQR